MEGGREEPGPEPRHPPIAIEEDQLSLTAKHSLDADSTTKIGQVGAAGHTDMLTVIDKLAGGRIPETSSATSQPRPAFQEGDLQTAIDQARRGCKTRETAADDDHVWWWRLGNGSHQSGTVISLGIVGSAAGFTRASLAQKRAASERRAIYVFRHGVIEIRRACTL